MTKFTTFSVEGLGAMPSLPGTFVVWANDANTVGIRTEWLHNRHSSTYAHLDMTGVSETVCLFRVNYSVNFFIHPVEYLRKKLAPHRHYNIIELGNTGWAMTNEDNSPIRRKDGSYNDYPSAAARKAAINKIALPLAQWIASSTEGQSLLIVAEVDDRQAIVNVIDAKLDKLAEVERKLLTTKAKLLQRSPVTDTEKMFARYGDITSFDEYERKHSR